MVIPSGMFLALALTDSASALTCDEVFAMTSTGRPEPQIVEAIKLGRELTLDDVTCLTAGGASRAIVDAAKWKLARSTTPLPVAPAPATAGSAGPRVDVEFVGAVFAGGKSDGTSWDLGGTTANAVGAAVSLGVAAAGGPGLARLGQVSAAGVAAPDPAGWVRLVPDLPGDRSSANRKLLLKSRADTYAPTFDAPPKYRGWVLDPSTTFEVHLWDDDAGAPDDVPAVRIGADALQAALASGGVYAVPVGDQSLGLLTHVLVQVRRSSLADRHVEGAPAP